MAKFEPIQIKWDYEPGQVVGLLTKGRYGLVLDNGAEAVTVLVLHSDKGGQLRPTIFTEHWPHQKIHLYGPKPNTLQHLVDYFRGNKND